MQQESLKKHRSVGRTEGYWWLRSSRSYSLLVLEEPRTLACPVEVQRNECCRYGQINSYDCLANENVPLESIDAVVSIKTALVNRVAEIYCRSLCCAWHWLRSYGRCEQRNRTSGQPHFVVLSSS